MSPGSYISFALHLGFVGWLVFSGDFSRKPSELSVADVSVISSEVFDIMVNNSSPEISTAIPSAEAIPVVEAAVGPSTPQVDEAPVQVPQGLSQISPGDALPSRRPDAVAPVQDVVILPPVELQAPRMEDSAQQPLQTSLPPKPRPAQRIAPTAIAAPDIEMDLGAQSREAAAPQEAPAEVAQAQEAQAPEAAAPEIVTEAEKPSAAPVVTANAPERSVRPRSRPAPPAAQVPEPAAVEPESSQIDPVTAALNAALMAGDEAPVGPEAAAAPLAEQFIRGMQRAIAECWNLGALSSAALSTIVVVEMELTRDGKPIANTIKMLGFEGGDDTSAERAFETALRAIQGCGAQGFDLPKDQFATWRRVELTFNPEKMRVR
ncbi:MAG: hypothetical protein P8H69_09680 [Planktomarina sp.]|jgi:hypothetical protein|nr:hypothetical protein [Planktomarina sp.]